MIKKEYLRYKGGLRSLKVSKAKEKYEGSLKLPKDYCHEKAIYADDYIKELEEQNEEMLELLIKNTSCGTCPPVDRKLWCSILDCNEYEKKCIIEKITGKSIKEVLKDE